MYVIGTGHFAVSTRLRSYGTALQAEDSAGVFWYGMATDLGYGTTWPVCYNLVCFIT